MDLLVKFSADESGASAVEYALMLVCIALTVAAAIKSLGLGVRGLFDSANAKYP